MAVRIYCTIVINVVSVLKYGDFNLISLLFCFTKSNMRYCPMAYTTAIVIKVVKPQLVDTLIISEMLLRDMSIINDATKIETITKNFLLLYLVTEIGKRDVIS